MDENRLKRLRMRSWRRGMKEMDLILGAYADGPLADLSGELLDLYEAMLNENDQDLYIWVTARLNPGAEKPTGPTELAAILNIIAGHAATSLTGRQGADTSG